METHDSGVFFPHFSDLLVGHNMLIQKKLIGRTISNPFWSTTVPLTRNVA